MAKTTFLGYVPSLKSKHEATIVGHKAIQSKGGSIRYTLQGEYQGRKTLPKTVSKADFESVYGFDAKEAEAAIIYGDDKEGNPVGYIHVVGHEDKRGVTPTEIHTGTSGISPKEIAKALGGTYDADTVGNPSPADVEPSAPSEKPFPQEPSNENFSAEERYDFITLKESGNKLIITLNEGADIEGYDEYEIFEDVSANSRWKLGEAYEIGGLSEAPVIFEIGYEGDVDDDDDDDDELPFYAVGTPYYYLNYQVSDWKEKLLDEGEVIFEGIEVKEALGLFGKKDAEMIECGNCDETFTIDEGLDIGGIDYCEECYDTLSAKEVKEAFGFGKKEEEPKTQEFTVVLQEGDKLELTDVEETEAAPDDENEEKEAETLENLEKGKRTFKITDIRYDTYDEEADVQQTQEDLGLPTEMTLSIDLEGDEKPHEIYDLLTNKIENQGDGWLVESFFCNDFDAETYEAVQAKVTRPVKEEKEESDEGLSTGAKVALGVGALAAGVALFGAEEDDYVPYESETDYSRIYEATSGDGYINHDRIDTQEQRMVDLRYDDPVSYYDWTSDEDVDEDDVKEAIKEELGDEPDKGTIGATVEVKNENDMYVDVDADIDTDYGDSRTMGLAAEHESESDGYAYAYTKGHNDGINDEVIYRPSIATDREKNIYKKILRQKADTVGSPSPSGPSSTPEPAEATGSEPSNENMEAEGSNMKMALGILGVGVGAVALLGGDRIKKIFEKLGL